MYDDYIGGQLSAAPRTVSTAQAHQVRQTSMTSTSITDTTSTPTNSYSQATNFPNSSHDVDGLKTQQQHAHQQGNHAPLQSKIVANTVPNAMFDANTFVNPFATPSTMSTMEPKNVKEAMTDPAWIESMQEELLQFKRLDVYVDDIIFGSTHPRYTQLFSDLIKSRFEMSMMGEMMFFLGLQVNQSPCGIFINQSIYVLEILKKYRMESYDPVGTPMEIRDKLDLDENGTPVDATKYRSMIGALMYLTSSRPDIDSGFKLTGFSDADYAGCKDTFKSTSGGAQFLGEKLISWSLKKQDCMTLSTVEAEYVSLSA
nr:hypothetical protein [Tanacetum cinerariifolium]